MAMVILDSAAPCLSGPPSASLCDDRLMPVISALAEAAGSSPARQHQHESRLQLSVVEACKHCHTVALASFVQTHAQALGGSVDPISGS